MQSINPNIRLKPKKIYTAEELLDGIKRCDRGLLSIAITYCESRIKKYRDIADQVLLGCIGLRREALKIGITGTPGVGKSTFIESLGKKIAEDKRNKVAVLAIDPSSQISHGSIMGDKTRMEKLSMLENVFIRPTSSGNYYGGVARSTYEAIIICEAAGFDYIFVETVGVGQSETDVKWLTDVFLLLLLPGGGDELQGIKRGIMEMADGIVFTKADMIPSGILKRSISEIKTALHYLPPNVWNIPVFVQPVSSISGEGMEHLWDKIVEYYEKIKDHPMRNEAVKQKNLYWFDRLSKEWLIERMFHFQQVKEVYEQQRIKAIDSTTHPVESIVQWKQWCDKIKIIRE